MSEFRMPSLGAAMEAGTLARWLRKEGDAVARGDIIAIVDTEKGAIEVEVFEDGIVESLLVEPGTEVPVGTPLAMIGTGPPSEAAAPAVAVEEKVAAAGAAVPEVAPTPAAGAVAKAPAARGPAARRISPAARTLAQAIGLDPSAVEGTGPGGAVTRDDIERAAAAGGEPAGAAAPADRAPAMRHAIAAAMAQSKREIPHYYLSTTIDMTAPLAWLEAENARRAVTGRLLPAALLLKAVALALRQVPELNGHWIDGAFRPGSGIHVGTAISLRGGGLVAPALHDVDRQDLSALMAGLQDLVRRARSGALRSSELSDPTITVTNLGDLGIDMALGIIHPPQVALVSFGKVLERPWVVDGAVVARPIVTAGLSVDHRAVDGHRAGTFLSLVGRLLQKPEEL